jgi:hypothetical protein
MTFNNYIARPTDRLSVFDTKNAQTSFSQMAHLSVEHTIRLTDERTDGPSDVELGGGLVRQTNASAVDTSVRVLVGVRPLPRAYTYVSLCTCN